MLKQLIVNDERLAKHGLRCAARRHIFAAQYDEGMAIVIITQDLNRGKFWVKVDGIQLDNYKKNPLLLFHHADVADVFGMKDKDEIMLPVGRLENLRIENDQLVADDPVWDEADPFAVKLKQKFDGGFMNAFSAGLLPIEVTVSPEHLKPGQERGTVWESELLEVSFVGIPKDGGAVRLSLEDGTTIDEVLPKISQQSNSDMDLKKIALKLGLKEGAGEDEILASIAAISTELDGHRRSRTATLLALGRQKGVVNDANAKQWERTIELDFDNAESLLSNFASIGDTKPEGTTAEKHPTAQELLKLAADKNAGTSGKKTSRDDWDFDKWSKEDPKGLNDMRLREPAKYEQLALEYAQS